MKPVGALQYIASHPELISSIGIDENLGSKHFYETGGLVTFDSYVYVASNWNNEKVRNLVDCAGQIDEKRVMKFYIRNGFVEKHETDSFEEWKFLANNPKRIIKLLDKIKNELRYEYDVYKLTKRNIAKEFVRKRGKSKNNTFDAIAFVKRYIDDQIYVNKEQKLSINNAAEYFVKYWVISAKIRYESSWKYKIAVFLKARVIGSLKHIPFHAVKYVAETRVI
jgi:hypothetical protein